MAQLSDKPTRNGPALGCSGEFTSPDSDVNPPPRGSAPSSANLAVQARLNFQRFWNAEADCRFEVIRGPEGSDTLLRRIRERSSLAVLEITRRCYLGPGFR